MAVRNVAEPLRLRLDIPPMQQHLDELQTLELLPQPLHTAFLQLRAAQEAFGLPADISISGKQRRPPMSGAIARGPLQCDVRCSALGKGLQDKHAADRNAKYFPCVPRKVLARIEAL